MHLNPSNRSTHRLGACWSPSFRVLKLFLFAVLAGLSSLAAHAMPNDLAYLPGSKITSTTAATAQRLALIYVGDGSDRDSLRALGAIAQKSGYATGYFRDPKVMVANLHRTSLLIFGGTKDDIDPLLLKFNNPETIQAMKDFVSNGGVYIGICGGAYLASEGYEDKNGWVKALGLAPVKTDSFMTDDAPIIIKVTWGDTVRPIYYQFGPKFIPSQPASVQVFSLYADKSIAAIVSKSEKGKVILLGHHPEADKSWIDNDDPKNAGDWIPTDDLADNLFAIAGDNSAATVPTGLAATAATHSQIDLSWTASTDNVGVVAYKIYRGTALIATQGTETKYSDIGLATASSYSYSVSGCDTAGNCSTPSTAVLATTNAGASSINQKSDCLFNSIESNYPAFVSPAGMPSQAYGPYYLRYYPQTKAYIGVTATNLYYLGPASSNALTDLGALSKFYAMAGCQ